MTVSPVRCAVLALALAASGTAGPACAAVVEAGADGFTVRETAHVSAPADRVYAQLVHPERWWSAEHTFSHSAANLSLEARAGGCYCERLPRGGSVLHMTVVAAFPGERLILRGALGPLLAQGVDGVLSLDLSAQQTGTDVTFTYTVGGHLTLAGGFSDWAPKVDGVLAEQLTRFARLIETGAPDARR